MGVVFTPGLKVAERTLVKKQRRLPLPGEVLTKKGDKVTANTLLARTELPGKVFPINVAGELGVQAEDVPSLVLKKEGEPVAKGEVIAEKRGFLGLFSGEVLSPIDGYIDSISRLSGQVMVREKPMTVTVDAYVDGEIVEIIENEGAVVATTATFIQGIFGLGGEVKGELKLVADRPSDVLDENAIDYRCRGKIIVGGSLLTRNALERALEQKVAGIVVGGMSFNDLPSLLGQKLGVAVTGSEKIGLTIVLTEGFGQIDMARHTFEIFIKNVGKRASMNGATQIRAGVVRPEVIIPLSYELPGVEKETVEAGLQIGSRVRAIRHPYFGKLGVINALPEALETMPSETKVRVCKVLFDNGEKAVMPRANIEAITGD
jgi:hypothetical protein